MTSISERFPDDNKPRVTVIISTYNRPKLVARAIESVLVQTFKDFELLVIDDCGSEETGPIVEAIADRDLRVRYIPNGTQRGLMENKNNGVKLSSRSSMYVAFLDDDDMYLPRFLERTVTALDADPELMAVLTDSELRSQSGKFIKYYPCEKEKFWRVVLGGGGGSTLRKDVFTKYNIWYDKDMIFEDWDFGIRVAKNLKWTGIPEVLSVYYRYHEDAGATMSSMYTKRTPEEIFERFLDRHKTVLKAAGSDALSYAHTITGKMLAHAGHVKAGQRHLWEAFKCHPNPSLLIYIVGLAIAPSAFNNTKLIILKNQLKNLAGR